ncbi:hypothetical protein HK097_009402 [Rhizophlyctis rosea]|uniref:Uncharacterized protein n=1 Tax=Rhizophlyctis rosea TaxID=64517 RepID=A0AAD5SBR0_9FUNG|nr:hypothetical protein HK097_009402 [Rhizophlyctis rosea]
MQEQTDASSSSAPPTASPIPSAGSFRDVVKGHPEEAYASDVEGCEASDLSWYFLDRKKRLVPVMPDGVADIAAGKKSRQVALNLIWGQRGEEAPQIQLPADNLSGITDLFTTRVRFSKKKKAPEVVPMEVVHFATARHSSISFDVEEEEKKEVKHQTENEDGVFLTENISFKITCDERISTITIKKSIGALPDIDEDLFLTSTTPYKAVLLGRTLQESFSKLRPNATVSSSETFDDVFAGGFGLLVEFEVGVCGLIAKGGDSHTLRIIALDIVLASARARFEDVITSRKLPLLVEVEGSCGLLVGAGLNQFNADHLPSVSRRRVSTINYKDPVTNNFEKKIIVISSHLIKFITDMEPNFDITLVSIRPDRLLSRFTSKINTAVAHAKGLGNGYVPPYSPRSADDVSAEEEDDDDDGIDYSALLTPPNASPQQPVADLNPDGSPNIYISSPYRSPAEAPSSPLRDKNGYFITSPEEMRRAAGSPRREDLVIRSEDEDVEEVEEVSVEGEERVVRRVSFGDRVVAGDGRMLMDVVCDDEDDANCGVLLMNVMGREEYVDADARRAIANCVWDGWNG